MTTTTPVDRDDALDALVHDTAEHMPPAWPRGTLTIERTAGGIDCHLENADEAARATTGAALRARCEALHVAMAARGNGWHRATVRVERVGDGVSFTTRFEYDDTAGDATGTRCAEGATTG